MHKQLSEIMNGIYELKLYQGNNEIRIFLIPGVNGQRSLLIDTGYRTEENWNILTQALEDLHINPQDLDVFLTHKHHDHTGMALLLSELGASIYMNPLEDRHPYDCLYYSQGAKSLEEQANVLKRVGVTEERTPQVWNCFKHFNEYYQNSIQDDCRKNMAFPYIPIGRGQIFSYGDYTFQTISLAGHTLGQLGLYDQTHHIVFSGDHIIRNIVRIVGTSYMNEHLLEQYLRSIDLFKTQYRTCTIYPSHGESFSNAGPIAANITAAYRKQLLDIQHILTNSAEALTVQEVAFRLYGVYNMPSDLTNFFKMKSMLSKTFSCLEYLYDQQYCQRMEKDGVLFYR